MEEGLLFFVDFDVGVRNDDLKIFLENNNKRKYVREDCYLYDFKMML